MNRILRIFVLGVLMVAMTVSAMAQTYTATTSSGALKLTLNRSYYQNTFLPGYSSYPVYIRLENQSTGWTFTYGITGTENNPNSVNTPFSYTINGLQAGTYNITSTKNASATCGQWQSQYNSGGGGAISTWTFGSAVDPNPTPTYTLTVTAGSNGTATGGATGLKTGDTRTITATPNPGYKFNGWTLTGAGTLNSTTNASATFTTAAGNATATASFAAIPPQSAPTGSLTATGRGTSNGGETNNYSVTVGQTVSFSVNGADVDGDLAGIRVWVYKDNSFGWTLIHNGANGSTFSYALSSGIGTYQFHSRAYDSGGRESVTAVINIAAVSANTAPTIAWTEVTATYLRGSGYTAVATGSDVDGNLASVWVEQSINGGAWTPFAYNGGGNGYTNKSDRNVGSAGAWKTTYQFRALASDSAGANTGWIYSAVYTVGNTPPVNLAVTVGATFTYGQAIPMTVRSTDVDGDLVAHHVVVSNASYASNSWEGTDPSGWRWHHFNTYIPTNGLDNTATFNLSDANYGQGALLLPGTYHVTLNAQDSVPNYTYDAARIMATFTVTKANQAALTAAAGSATYGNTITATVAGGSGSGAVTWALGAGSTASGAAINATTGVISATSTGDVVVTATKAADGTYNAATATATATFTARPITVTLTGAKVYDEGTNAKDASATISSGSLASGDAATFSYKALPKADVGSYPNIQGVVIKNGASVRTTNYSITYAGSYTVSKSATATTGGYSNPFAVQNNFTTDTITLTGTVKSATTNNGIAAPTFTVEKIEGITGTYLVAGQVITTPFVVGGVVGSGDDRGGAVGLITIRADYPGTTNYQGSTASSKILIQVVNPTYRSRLAAGAWPQSGLEAWLNPSPVTEDTYTVRRPR